jgi:glycogen operon protein
MPKAVVVDETFNWGRREMLRPNIPWQDTIIYEAHVKGLTQRREEVAPGLRGTYGGLSSPAMIDHFKRLGVTTVELLPIHGLVDDRMLVEKKLSNYWGYNTLAFFAPEPRYAQDNALDSFRTTVARLHDAGIEVMLDVVYNHTAEGNHLGPTLSFRGIDNASSRPSSSSPSPGTSAWAAIRSARIPRNGRSGTTAIAARCGVTGAAKAA